MVSRFREDSHNDKIAQPRQVVKSIAQESILLLVGAA